MSVCVLFMQALAERRVRLAIDSDGRVLDVLSGDKSVFGFSCQSLKGRVLGDFLDAFQGQYAYKEVLVSGHTSQYRHANDVAQCGASTSVMSGQGSGRERRKRAECMVCVCVGVCVVVLCVVGCQSPKAQATACTQEVTYTHPCSPGHRCIGRGTCLAINTVSRHGNLLLALFQLIRTVRTARKPVHEFIASS